jgi:hypothetical protein
MASKDENKLEMDQSQRNFARLFRGKQKINYPNTWCFGIIQVVSFQPFNLSTFQLQQVLSETLNLCHGYVFIY